MPWLFAQSKRRRTLADIMNGLHAAARLWNPSAITSRWIILSLASVLELIRKSFATVANADWRFPFSTCFTVRWSRCVCFLDLPGRWRASVLPWRFHFTVTSLTVDGQIQLRRNFYHWITDLEASRYPVSFEQTQHFSSSHRVGLKHPHCSCVFVVAYIMLVPCFRIIWYNSLRAIRW